MSKQPYGGRDEGWPVRVNVRIRSLSPLTKPDNNAAWTVLEALAKTGHVPDGWEIAAVKWQYVKKDGSGGAGDANDAWPDSGTGWRKGDVSDLAPLLAPALVGQRLQVGWEPRTRRVETAGGVAWVRYRSVGTRSRDRGQWVSESYARRYPHLVYKVAKERKRRFVTITDYEAEVRVDYNP